MPLGKSGDAPRTRATLSVAPWHPMTLTFEREANLERCTAAGVLNGASLQTPSEWKYAVWEGVSFF